MVPSCQIGYERSCPALHGIFKQLVKIVTSTRPLTSNSQFPCSNKLSALTRLCLRMPTANSNAPSVDARYVKNLTINITYNTGTSWAVNLHLSLFIHFFGTIPQDRARIMARTHSIDYAQLLYGMNIDRYYFIIRIQVPQNSTSDRSRGQGRGPMNECELYEMLLLS